MTNQEQALKSIKELKENPNLPAMVVLDENERQNLQDLILEMVAKSERQDILDRVSRN